MNAFTEWMTKVGLRPTDVARALGLRDTAIWKYSRDKYWPSREVALRLKRFTGGKVTMDALLDDDVDLRETEEYRLGRAAIREAQKRRNDRDGKREKDDDGQAGTASGAGSDRD